MRDVFVVWTHSFACVSYRLACGKKKRPKKIWSPAPLESSENNGKPLEQEPKCISQKSEATFQLFY